MGLGCKRRLTEIKDTFQYVPLLAGLQTLLKNDDIRHEVGLFYEKYLITCIYMNACIYAGTTVSYQK